MSFQTTNELVLSIASFLAANSKMKEEEPVDECPICLEVVELRANRVITECGHIFHCKCLVTNIAHNGFACPYCRTVMAEEIEDEDSEDDYDSGEWYYGPEESDDDDSVSVAGPGLESHLLRGMRWFFQRVEPQDGEEFDDTVWETDSEEDEEEPLPIMNDDTLFDDTDNQFVNNLNNILSSSSSYASSNDSEAINLYDEFTATLPPANDAHVQHMMKLYKDFVASLENDTTLYLDGFDTFIAALSAPHNEEDVV